MRRARELIELHKGRDRLKQLGDMGLARSKERVDAVTAGQARRGQSEGQKR